MTLPKYSDLLCSSCGALIGKQKGVQVVLGLICSKPICNYQDEVTVNEQRDAFVVAAVLGNVPVARVARGLGVSRQRIYQIVDTWKEGI